MIILMAAMEKTRQALLAIDYPDPDSEYEPHTRFSDKEKKF